jgi:hypothetical protein
VQPLHIPLPKGGETFWLDPHTVAHVIKNDDGKLELYGIPIKFEAASLDSPGVLAVAKPSKLIGTFPTNGATNFRYNLKSGMLVFSEDVYEDGNLFTLKKQDEAFENRGNTAKVYDETYERHWDHWLGPKQSTLFSVRLWSDWDYVWRLENNYKNLLQGTGHVK